MTIVDRTEEDFHFQYSLSLSVVCVVYFVGSFFFFSKKYIQDLLLHAGIIKVGTYVIWYCGSTNSSNWYPIIQSKSHWDNRDFSRKFSGVCNARSCDNCKWCFTLWISSNPVTSISSRSCMDVLPLAVESNRWTKKSFLFWPSVLNLNVRTCFISLSVNYISAD